jgi:organic radical activating enzyme
LQPLGFTAEYQTAKPLQEVRAMDLSIVDGRLRTRSLEVHIVDHCNLRCWGCCSLSPLLPPREIVPEDLERDLTLARRALWPATFKLVGGEPLLHPRLLDCLRIARSSAIAERVSVTTNGHLLDRLADEFWQLIDGLTISLYPRPPLSQRTIARTETLAARFGVQLNWKRQDQFVDMTRDAPETDPQVNRQVWDTCWLKRRCHHLADGRFYACTRPAHFQTFFRGRQDFTGDGVQLHDGPGLAEEIRDYLLRDEPLAACAHCRGGNAALEPHRQLTLLEVRAAVEAKP